MGNRVLVVEDYADGREALAELLRLEGYDVTSAPNGADAIAQVAIETVDVLVVDLDLRGAVMGIDVIGIAKNLPVPPAVVAFTGHPRLKAHAEASGCEAVVLKPDLDELLARLDTTIAARTTKNTLQTVTDGARMMAAERTTGGASRRVVSLPSSDTIVAIRLRREREK